MGKHPITGHLRLSFIRQPATQKTVVSAIIHFFSIGTLGQPRIDFLNPDATNHAQNVAFSSNHDGQSLTSHHSRTHRLKEEGEKTQTNEENSQIGQRFNDKLKSNMAVIPRHRGVLYTKVW